VQQICSLFSGGKYFLSKYIQFSHSKRMIEHEVHDTVTEIVEVADEMVNRTMAIVMFRHQRTPVVLLRTCHHVSPLCLGLYEVQQVAAYLPFPSRKVVFFFRGTGLVPVMTGSELNSSLLSTSRLQDTLENFLAKFCRYKRKYLLRASAALMLYPLDMTSRITLKRCMRLTSMSVIAPDISGCTKNLRLVLP
jgi:hypothetical protein